MCRSPKPSQNKKTGKSHPKQQQDKGPSNSKNQSEIVGKSPAMSTGGQAKVNTSANVGQ